MPLIAQPRVREAIEHSLTTGRVAQSYLFHGPEGTGKRAAALALAGALLCERSGTRACGACLACTKVRRGLHPDVHVYLPHPKDARADDLNRRVQILFGNPYARVDFQRRPSLDDEGKTSGKQAIYFVALIEEIIRDLRFVPVEGAYNVGILVDADRMNEPTANKFLKMLEEPPDRTILILTAERTDEMLPTVISRCRHVRFDPLPAEAIEKVLMEGEGVPPARAAFIARMADGSLTAAQELLSSKELSERRRLAIDFIRQAFSRHPDRLLPLVQEISGLGREPARHFFRLMLGWVRDVILYRTSGEGAPLINVDEAEAVRKFAAGLPDADTRAMVGLIEEASGLVERNGHMGLVLLVLADALADAMQGVGRERLFDPLDTPAMRVMA